MDFGVWGFALSGLAGLLVGGALVTVVNKYLRPQQRRVNGKQPWRLGTLGIVMVSIGAMLVMTVAVADTLLVLADHPGGLPEVVATSVFGVANIIVGYGGACLTARSEGKSGDEAA